MPELPEVETIVRDLRKKIIDLQITDITIHDGRVVRQSTYKEFSRKLKNQSIAHVSRRGKAIIIELTYPKSFLVVQLMMTGQLIVSSDSIPQRDTKVSFQLSNKNCLHYNDYRTFGRLQVVVSLDEIPYFKALGPEPLEKNFTVSWLTQELKKRKMPIKPLLLNHMFVAGIGNIYASEILFASGIDPRRPALSLGKEEISLLHRVTKKILQQAIRHRGTSMNTYRDATGAKGKFMNRIKVYGREKEACYSCDSVLVREFQAGRSTFYCPECQK
ncbi:MAG: bifunctional DNA-formamidopyrimidine glycosylase/DNA-(apurinic or apyrimidinic site) lyase [Candidatus Omnitrophica bacterium]|nr:bifunctional DNA-formamidopyrimidine glycosylase/DNA-(apurinic or apyrimidinic site) lyase [Candidatus Omnitrophota bacterium]